MGGGSGPPFNDFVYMHYWRFSSFGIPMYLRRYVLMENWVGYLDYWALLGPPGVFYLCAK
jgi:hypothetical protein